MEQVARTYSGVEKVEGLTGFVIIHVLIASFSPVEGERNQMVNAKFTRPVNAMPMSSAEGCLSPIRVGMIQASLSLPSHIYRSSQSRTG